MSTVNAALPPRLRQPRRRIPPGYAVAARRDGLEHKACGARPVQDPPEAGARGASGRAGCGHRFLIRNDDSSGRACPNLGSPDAWFCNAPACRKKPSDGDERGKSVQALRCEQDDNSKSSVGGSRSASDRQSGSFQQAGPLPDPFQRWMANQWHSFNWPLTPFGMGVEWANLQSGRAVCIARCGLWTWCRHVLLRRDVVHPMSPRQGVCAMDQARFAPWTRRRLLTRAAGLAAATTVLPPGSMLHHGTGQSAHLVRDIPRDTPPHARSVFFTH